MVELEQMYFSIPVVTRIWLTLAFLTAGAVTFEFLNPLSLYLNFKLIREGEVWRLVTCFLYFDPFSVHLFFHLHFLHFNSRRLEEHFYHRRTSRYLYMLLFGAVILLALAAVLDLPFLSHSLVLMVLYVWSRRNPDEHLSIYGLVTLSAPYLAYLLVGLDFVFGSLPMTDIIGITAGHIFWYIEDILPRLLKRNKELVPTPGFLVALFPHEAAG